MLTQSCRKQRARYLSRYNFSLVQKFIAHLPHAELLVDYIPLAERGQSVSLGAGLNQVLLFHFIDQS
jgi:hypothetical protein